LEFHPAHMIFRGVCPELLFLDSFGYIVTTDFRCGLSSLVVPNGSVIMLSASSLSPASNRFSKLGVERTFTLCGGRPGYVAPEQVSHAGESGD
jgi:hypothetical protein